MLSVNATTQFSKSSQLISPTHDFNENNPTFNNMLNLLTKKLAPLLKLRNPNQKANSIYQKLFEGSVHPSLNKLNKSIGSLINSIDNFNQGDLCKVNVIFEELDSSTSIPKVLIKTIKKFQKELRFY